MTPEQLRDYLYRKWDVRARPQRPAIRRDDTDGHPWHIFPDAPGPNMKASPSKDWTRHTVDIQQPPPQHVEDDSLAAERGEWWARVVWMVLGVAFVAYVAIRIWVGGGQ